MAPSGVYTVYGSPATRALVLAKPIIERWEWWVAPWLAGLVDGEGSVMVWRRKTPSNKYQLNPTWRTTIVVCNTKRKLVDKVLESVGVGRVRVDHRKPHLINCCDCYVWGIESGGIRLVAEKILPFSVIKQRQLRLLIEARHLIETHVNACVDSTRIDEIAAEVKQLNRKGIKYQEV